MTRDHDLIEELLAAKALGGLDADDATQLEREMAEHGDCDQCRRLEAAFDETAGMLAFALEPRPVDPGVADEILARAKADEPGPEPSARGELAPRRARRAGGWRVVVGVAASIVVLAAGVAVLRPPTSVDVALGDQTFVEFHGGAGTLTMAYTPGQPGVVLWGNDLPAPGSDKVYALWMIADGMPVKATCLEPDAQGRVAAYLNTDLGSTELMAVTVESPSCPDAPTTEPLYVAEIV